MKRIFGQKDVEILETLLWPFLNTYNYTNKSKTEFIDKLGKIKPFIGKPLEFELKLKKHKAFKNNRIYKIDPFKKMHQQFFDAHEILTEKKTYPFIIKPLSRK